VDNAVSSELPAMNESVYYDRSINVDNIESNVSNITNISVYYDISINVDNIESNVSILTNECVYYDRSITVDNAVSSELPTMNEHVYYDRSVNVDNAVSSEPTTMNEPVHNDRDISNYTNTNTKPVFRKKIITDPIYYDTNDCKTAIINNEYIEDKLHVIMIISNPCLFAKRYLLANEFKKRMETEEHVILYIVELAYKSQKFVITDNANKNHLQIKATDPLWHKENMINIGVNKLLPATWKSFAWIDADVEFENVSWAKDTLKILNGCKDIVQLFSHAIDMDTNKLTMNVYNSAGYQYSNQNPYTGIGNNYWHPGYAWACTRKAYEKMGGLYDYGILGSSDNIMMLSLIGRGINGLHKDSSESYVNTVVEFQDKLKSLRFGYVPGVIKHHFHGQKVNRKYQERWGILVKHNYDPILHLTCNDDGLYIPTPKCPKQLLDNILQYFTERNEDDV
jgi:hypothetical protein